MSRRAFRHDPRERDKERFRPRWWWFGLFALNVAVHLPLGWDSSAAVGLPLGFVVTLLLVFVPRLPKWLTRAGKPGDGREPDDADEPADSVGNKRLWPRLLRRGCLVLVTAGAVAAVAGGTVTEPPAPDEVVAAVFVWVLAVGFLLFAVGWLLVAFRRPREPVYYDGPFGFVPPGARLEAVPSASPRGVAVAARVDGDTSQWNWWSTLAPVRATVTLPDGRIGYLVLSGCPGPLALAVVRTGKLWLHGKGLRGEGGRVTGEFGAFSAAGLLTTDPAGHVPGRRLRPWGASLCWLVWQNRLRLPALVFAVAAAVAVPVAGIVWSGWAWSLLIPALVVAGAVGLWSSEVGDEHREVAEGPLTPVPVLLVDDHVWPATEVRVWAVLGPGRPVRLDIATCPPEIAAELVAHRRVWVFGEPRTGLVSLGRPGRGVFASGYFLEVGPPQRQPASSTPPGTGAEGS